MEIFITADGSPTLTLRRADGYGEKMHHSGGALSESLYIYHSALSEALNMSWNPRVFSFGLGLGYNELITIAELLRRNLINDWSLVSFELEDLLRGGFRQWLNGHQSELGATYDQILQMIAERLDVSGSKIKDLACAGLEDGRFELRGPFPQDSLGVQKCAVVYFDAFSKKMDTSPWTEENLIGDLAPCLADECILATYAATGSLNRALRTLGFTLVPKSGFQGKRESTLAIRKTKTK